MCVNPWPDPRDEDLDTRRRLSEQSWIHLQPSFGHTLRRTLRASARRARASQVQVGRRCNLEDGAIEGMEK